MLYTDKKSRTKLVIINKDVELDKLIAYCKETKCISIDFETNAQPVASPLMYPTILGVSFQPGSSYIIPLGHFDSPFKNKWKKVLKKFGKEVLENPEITKFAHNAEFEYQVCLAAGFRIQGRILCTMLGKYLLDENTPNSLESLISRFLPNYHEAKLQDGFDKLPWDKKPLIPLSIYCGNDCDTTYQLGLFLENRLIKGGFYSLYRNMMGMGLRVEGEASFNGVHINVPYLKDLVRVYDKKIIETEKALRDNIILRRYEKKRLATVKTQLIKEVQEAMEAIDDTSSVKYRNLEKKLTSYIAGNLTTKKDLKKVEPFNFNSTTQLRELFFTDPAGFKFKVVKYTEKKDDRRMKVETENPSTDEEVLLTLQAKDKHGFIKALLDYRGLTKLQSTYIEGMVKNVLPSGTIHARFLLHGTVTGRLSSRNPNLQNIPRDTTAKDIKKMFVAPPGYMILQLDYSQAELRVLAAAAGETTMLEWFRTGKDVHLASACKKHGWDYEDRIVIYEKEDKNDPRFNETKIARKQAKTINFGIVYGQGAAALAGTLSEPEKGVIVTKEGAAKFLSDFHKQFPKISAYIKKQHKLVNENGYVKSVFGRKRRLPGIWAPDFGTRAKAERDTINAPIQGAASDYALFSSIIIYEEILKGNLPTLSQRITVHDSLWFYIKPEYIHEVVPKLASICANPQTKKFFGFQIDDVLMQVDFEVGKDWANLSRYNENNNYVKLEKKLQKEIPNKAQ